MIEGKPVKVYIASPVGDMCPAFWANDMYKFGAYNAIHGINTGIIMASGSLIPKQRNTLVKAVLQDESFTHIMWLDSDLRFPPSTLERLLAHKLPIVCATYTERSYPFRPTAFPDFDDPGLRIFTTPENTGLVEIKSAGFGCVLVETDYLRKMSKPWFMVGYNTETDSCIGEDIYFFYKFAKETGAKVMMDYDLTKEILHIGRFEFSYMHALQNHIAREEARKAEEEAKKQEEEKDTSGTVQLVS